ncbi:MAG: methyltransferase [Planctomycetota bacterium]|nr:methyltransferase [Planctomycetota bacterium]
MSNSDPLSVRPPKGYYWHGQIPHLLLLIMLVAGAWAIAKPALGDGAWLGVSDVTWFAWALAVPIVQQIAVALLWRAQLCYGMLTRLFGDAGFIVWGVIFFPLLLARPLLTLAVGLADPGSLSTPRGLAIGFGILLLLPAVWTMHSVAKYFGFARALGGDHFFERYRAMPMVRQGAFAYTSNAMYGLAFLSFWGIALITGSRAALAVALFQHAYIWVHWYCTEQPDGVVLYGRAQDEVSERPAP